MTGGQLLGELSWNNDPAWVEYIERFEKVIRSITVKYTQEEGLREDCAQDARIALLHVWPVHVRGYEKYVDGEYTDEEWQANLDRYCRNVIRNTVLSSLDSLNSGDWYSGRTRRNLDRNTGKVRREHKPARYESLDVLQDSGTYQIDEFGEVISSVPPPFEQDIYDFYHPDDV